ncbi:hypothetical protein TNCV_4667301 [Trichonephila clavipes]|nr:hypothetical protein TNCV_4667301 [Trichonephila clavipes]
MAQVFGSNRCVTTFVKLKTNTMPDMYMFWWLRFKLNISYYKVLLKKIMFDPSSFANPAHLAHADTLRDVLPRGGTSQLDHGSKLRGPSPKALE